MLKWPLLKPRGIVLTPPPDEPKLLEGKDFPAGIESLDLSFFEKQFTLEKVFSCDSVAEMVRLQHWAAFVMELRRLQELAKNA